MRFYDGLTVMLVGSAIVVIQPAIAVALTGEQVNDMAREITVLIRGKEGHGSGVIIAKNEKTYYVLTANHVVSDPDEYKIVTIDQQAYPLDASKVKSLPGVDLAVVEFSSNKKYQVAKLANSDTLREGKPVFVSGWPQPGGTGQVVRQFTDGRISGFLDQAVEGYKIIYTNVTRRGMSGGPVVDAGGRVVGIHGWGDTEKPEVDALQQEGLSREAAVSIASLIKPGFNYAIPINTFLSLAPQQGIYLSLQVDNSPAQELGAPLVASSQPNKKDTINNLNEVLGTAERALNTFQQFRGILGR